MKRTIAILATSVAISPLFAADKKPAIEVVTPPVSAADAKPAKAGEGAKPANAPVIVETPAPAGEPVALGMVIPAVVAKVDGEEIKREELEKNVRIAMARFGGGDVAQMPEEFKRQAYGQVLGDMIMSKLVEKRSAKVEITDTEIAEVVGRLKGNFPNEAAFTEQLTKNGQSLDSIKSEIKASLKQRKWVQDQVKDKVSVTDKDAEEFYKTNPDQFKEPEQVKASHILISVNKEAKSEEVTAKEKEVKAILERVNKGEDFDKLAGELSQDPSAKQNKGDLGFFAAEAMVPEFSKAAFAMKKGETSKEPVRSDFGFHIIKVTDRKEPKDMKLEEVKTQLLDYLRRQKEQTEIGKVLEKLRADSKIETFVK